MKVREDNKRDEKGWLLREKILEISHRWDILFLFLLAGVLFGWLMSYLWPSQYQASRNVYVGLNAYRFSEDTYIESLAGQPFRFADDYKDWQMEQLGDLSLSEEFIVETLDILRNMDLKWQMTTIDSFRQMAVPSWRNVGEWHLVVVAEDPQRASEAVLAWEKVLLERANEAIQHSRDLVSLDVEMKLLVEEKYRLELRQENLNNVDRKLSDSRDKIDLLTEGSNVPSVIHTNLLTLASLIADRTPAWDRILDQAPLIGSTTASYLNWIDDVEALIRGEVSLLPDQIAILNSSYMSLSERYGEEAASSYGLASTLVIEGDKDQSIDIEVIRPRGLFFLTGMSMGLCFWLFWAFRTIKHDKAI